MQKLMVLLGCLWMVLGGTVSVEARQATPENAKISVEIQSGDNIRKATVSDKLVAGDSYRVKVSVKSTPVFLYVVYADQNMAVMVNGGEDWKAVESTEAVIPPEEKNDPAHPRRWYEITGSSKLQFLTVICSSTELSEMTPLLDGYEIRYEQWKALEQTLIEQSKVAKTSEKTGKPVAIGGTVRSLQKSTETTNELSGNSLVVKKYEFRVKN